MLRDPIVQKKHARIRRSNNKCEAHRSTGIANTRACVYVNGNGVGKVVEFAEAEGGSDYGVVGG